MDSTEYRADIKFFVLGDLSTNEINKKNDGLLKEPALSFPTVHPLVSGWRLSYIYSLTIT